MELAGIACALGATSPQCDLTVFAVVAAVGSVRSRAVVIIVAIVVIVFAVAHRLAHVVVVLDGRRARPVIPVKAPYSGHIGVASGLDVRTVLIAPTARVNERRDGGYVSPGLAKIARRQVHIAVISAAVLLGGAIHGLVPLRTAVIVQGQVPKRRDRGQQREQRPDGPHRGSLAAS